MAHVRLFAVSCDTFNRCKILFIFQIIATAYDRVGLTGNLDFQSWPIIKGKEGVVGVGNTHTLNTFR